MGVSRNEHLREIEEAAEEVLSDKQEIVDLDRKQCQNREAIQRALSLRQLITLQSLDLQEHLIHTSLKNSTMPSQHTLFNCFRAF